MRKIITPLVVISVLIGLVVLFVNLERIRTKDEVDEKSQTANDEVVVNSFDTCVLAGNPVQESYPRQCKDKNGVSFAEDIEEVSYDMILSNPKPNSSISIPLEISGEASGSWFFEGQFNAEIVDGDSEIVASGIMKAQGDWMTNELVAFEGKVDIISENDLNGVYELVLKSANPSGLPENQKIFSISVRIN